MLSINTNLSSLIVQNSLGQATSKLNQAIERMSTGFKINHASDNAANYSISTNMTTKMSAYMVAEDNTAMGLDLVTTASNTLDLVSGHVQRIRDLCEQASNGTYGAESLKAIQAEIDARQLEIERIISQTEYNGIKILEGDTIAEGVTGKFLAPVTQLSEEEALDQGYTIIRTADELQAMEDDLSGKYILMNDIDLEGYDWTPVDNFAGELNGNGYVIKNLTINSDKIYVGLFGNINTAKIHNVAIENADVNSTYPSSGAQVGILVGHAERYDGTFFENCYVTGTVTSTNVDTTVGGIAGLCETGAGGSIINCYADVILNSSGPDDKDALCNEMAGGISNVTNSYYVNTKSTSDLGTGLTIAELNAMIIPPTAGTKDRNINLQVGTDGDSNSQISFVSSIALDSLAINCLDSTSARNSLQILDDYLDKISAKQVEYGAVTNRLESALDEIAIQYDNLASSRSTLRDADMAELSSTYIQQQILQQASATLLATANQSPSIALQLI